MKTLVFDTCFNKTYIALFEQGNIYSIKSRIIESNEQNYHSVYLVPAIRDILVQNKMEVKDIGAIGVNIGPGSFTGIRSGVVIARVLAQQYNIKLIGVNSLRILSFLNHTDTKTKVILDARKNKVYYGEYEQGKELISPCLKDKEEIVSLLKNEQPLGADETEKAYDTRLDKNSCIISDTSINKFLMDNGVKSINYEISSDNLGIYLANIVDKELENSQLDYNWAKVKPLYIQKPSITKPKEKIDVHIV